jgi:hypothetical protein
MVGAYKPCAEFIKLAKRVGMSDTVFCNISFVGTEALLNELGDAGEGCIISQVVHFPWDTSLPLAAQFQKAMDKYQEDERAGFVAFEGYMVGRLFGEIAKAVEGDLTHESFMQTVEQTGTFEIGGVTLSYGPEDHQGLEQVFLTVIKGGKINPLETE